MMTGRKLWPIALALLLGAQLALAQAPPPPTPSARGTKNRKLPGLYKDIQQPGYLDFIGVNHTNLGSTIFMKLNGETGLKLD